MISGLKRDSHMTDEKKRERAGHNLVRLWYGIKILRISKLWDHQISHMDSFQVGFGVYMDRVALAMSIYLFTL